MRKLFVVAAPSRITDEQCDGCSASFVVAVRRRRRRASSQSSFSWCLEFDMEKMTLQIVDFLTKVREEMGVATFILLVNAICR